MTQTQASERAESISQDLLGSCGTLPEEVLCEPALAEALDELCVECPGCGWWVEPSDLEEGPDGDDVCSDCAREG